MLSPCEQTTTWAKIFDAGYIDIPTIKVSDAEYFAICKQNPKLKEGEFVFNFLRSVHGPQLHVERRENEEVMMLNIMTPDGDFLVDFEEK
jgi:hypothetical protein